MPQSFSLDPDRRRFYYPLVAIGLLCAVGCLRYESIAPDGLARMSAGDVAGWVDEFALAQPTQVRLRWRFRNTQGRSSGRAVVRLAPPDTLRFDFRGPFGKSGSAVVVGGQALWAAPEQDFEDLIPVAPVFWAALGIASRPPEGAQVFGLDGPERRAWRFERRDEATDFIFVRGPEPKLLAELRVHDEILATSELRLDGDTRQPVSAMMTFPLEGSRFSFTIEAIDTVAAYDPETWTQK